MLYAMNKLRRSAYLCTPSGNQKQGLPLLLLSLFILHYFSSTPKSGLQQNARHFAAARYTYKQKSRKTATFGAEDEIRTRDVHLGKVTLYH